MTYDKLMSMKPNLWHWEMLSFKHSLSEDITLIYYFVIAMTVIFVGVVGAGEDKIWGENPKKYKYWRFFSIIVFVCATIPFHFILTHGYHDVKIAEWERNEVRDYVKQQDITGEVLVDDMTYNYVSSDSGIQAIVSFPMNDTIQRVRADVVEKDIEKTYLKYYVNDKDISNSFRKGNANIGVLYVPKGSVVN